jgi:hypothetical protein
MKRQMLAKSGVGDLPKNDKANAIDDEHHNCHQKAQQPKENTE